MVYVRTLLIAGVIVPVFLHWTDRDAMPWWPDTVSLGLAFGVVAVVIVSRYRRDRERNRRVWTMLKAWARRFSSS